MNNHTAVNIKPSLELNIELGDITGTQFTHHHDTLQSSFNRKTD